MDSGVNEQEEIKIEDGFVWVDRMSIEEKEDIVNVSSDLAGANVAGNNEDEDILNVEVKEAADVDVLLMEQQYWQRDSTGKQSYSSKRKYRCRQRLTQSELDMIAHQKTIARSPSYYQFDESTTLILKMLRQKNIVGDYHNIVGYGKNSVVIHANWPASARSWYQMGVAVKVYKLQQDQYHDNVLLKRAQNEYNHLNLLNRRRSTMGTPGLIFKSRNVIATFFVGVDQETAPSIASVPIEDSGKMYSTLVNDLCKLYKEYNLVHGRLSSKNILFYYNAQRYIGWAHSVESDHPLAPRKLMRDCHFITEFYRKRGVYVVTKEDLFRKVTGLKKINIKALNTISTRDMWETHPTNPNKNNEDSSNKHKLNNSSKIKSHKCASNACKDRVR